MPERWRRRPEVSSLIEFPIVNAGKITADNATVSLFDALMARTRLSSWAAATERRYRQDAGCDVRSGATGTVTLVAAATGRGR